MVSTHTQRKRLEKQGVGENNNAWGGYLNTNMIDMVDECFGVVCVAMTTNGDSTLSTNNGASDQGRRSQIILTGAPTSNVRLFVPAVESFYLVRNKMTGSSRVRLTNAGGVNGVDFSGSGSGAEQGLVISDGTNVREVVRTVSVGSFSIFTRGMIMPFYNSVGAIPTGWLNCDGTNGTPNLNDKFILGTTSNGLVDVSGGSMANLTTTSAGDHSHTSATGSTTLTSANIPAHAHYIAAEYSDVLANRWDQGTQVARSRLAVFGVIGNDSNYLLLGHVTSTPSVGETSWAYTSSPTGHTHSVFTGGGHQHTVTVNRPPYHQMLYIMKA